MLVTLTCVNCKTRIHVLGSHAHLPRRCPKCGGMLTAELKQAHRRPPVGKPEYLGHGLSHKGRWVKAAALASVLLVGIATGVYFQWDNGEIARLVDQLSENDNTAWGAALERLVDKGTKAVPALIEALHYQDEKVRERAREALTRIGEPAIRPLVDRLTDENNGLYQTAVAILKGIDNTASLPELLELFQGTSSPRAQEVIAEAFESLADKRCVQAIVEALKPKDDPTYNMDWNRRMDQRLRKIIHKVAAPDAVTAIELPEATGERESWVSWWQKHHQIFE